jgi:hypothetical protein
MARFEGYSNARKAVVASIVLWTIACAAMFWAMHNSSRAMITIFLVVAGVPIAAMFGLLLVSRYLDKVTAPREPWRGVTGTGRGKKRVNRSS